MNQNQTQQDNNTTTTDIDQQQMNNKNQDDQNEETSTTIMEKNHQQTNKENQQGQNKEAIATNNIVQTQTNNHENITLRKPKLKTLTKKYTIENQALPKNNDNYPKLNKSTNLTESLNANKTQPPQNHKNPIPDEITIIPEMQIIPETEFQESSGLQFSSPSMVTKNRYNILQSTPETIDSSTPNINTCKQMTPTPQNQQHQQAKIFAIRLHKMSFVNTGCFINTTTKEKENMAALSMPHALGKYDPSDKHIQNYRNKIIIKLYNHRIKTHKNKQFI